MSDFTAGEGWKSHRNTDTTSPSLNLLALSTMPRFLRFWLRRPAKQLWRELLADAQRARPQGGTMADVLLDRLAVVPVDRLSADAAFSILAALSNVMDDVGASGGETDFGRYPSWESAIRAFRHLIHRVTGPRHQKLLRRIFSEGLSLGWIMHVIRAETFDHGRFGDRAKTLGLDHVRHGV